MRTYLILASILLAGPVNGVENGRLTDTACYILLGAIVMVLATLARIEYRVRRGTLNPYTLPVWLQDPSDGPEAGVRR